MVIDFNAIPEEAIMDFKGGKGELRTRNFVDGKCKIMMSSLAPGASSGLHTHEGNCEIVHIISGEARFVYDGKAERVKAGDVHYCPVGHSHYMVNDTTQPVSYLAIVAEHH